MGVLSEVKGNQSNDGIFDDTNNVEGNIELVLPKKQKELTWDTSKECWTPSENDYKDTKDYGRKTFLEMTFKSITLQ